MQNYLLWQINLIKKRVVQAANVGLRSKKVEIVGFQKDVLNQDLYIGTYGPNVIKHFEAASLIKIE